MAKEPNTTPAQDFNVGTLHSAVERLKQAFIAHSTINVGDNPQFADDASMIDVVEAVAQYLETN